MIYYYIIFVFITIGFTLSGGPQDWSGRQNVKERKARGRGEAGWQWWRGGDWWLRWSVGLGSAGRYGVENVEGSLVWRGAIWSCRGIGNGGESMAGWG